MLLAVCILIAGCASTNYSTFEGGRVIEGTGGTKKTVEGMDIWNNGSPPRKYKIVGIIDDVRRDALIQMSLQEKALVKKAREAGGDAILFLDSKSEVLGFSNSGGAQIYGDNVNYQGSSTAIRNKITKVAVIKFVD